MLKSHAIETEFNGIRFRSRMEARWAVFMDCLGIRFFYEMEAYSLGNGVNYLPDFYLPKQDCFVEIKNPLSFDDDASKLSLLAEFTKRRCFCFRSPPVSPVGLAYDPGDFATCFFDDPPGGVDEHYLWCQCPRCDMYDIQFDGRSDRIKCGCPKSGDRGHNYQTPSLIHSYQVSKSWRFEPGACNP